MYSVYPTPIAGGLVIHSCSVDAFRRPLHSATSRDAQTGSEQSAAAQFLTKEAVASAWNSAENEDLSAFISTKTFVILHSFYSSDRCTSQSGRSVLQSLLPSSTVGVHWLVLVAVTRNRIKGQLVHLRFLHAQTHSRLYYSTTAKVQEACGFCVIDINNQAMSYFKRKIVRRVISNSCN